MRKILSNLYNTNLLAFLSLLWPSLWVLLPHGAPILFLIFSLFTLIKGEFSPQKTLSVPFYLFLGWSLLACSWSFNPTAAFYKWGITATTLTLGYSLLWWNNPGWHTKTQKFLVLGWLFSIGLLVIETYGKGKIYCCLRELWGQDCEFRYTKLNQGETLVMLLSWSLLLCQQVGFIHKIFSSTKLLLIVAWAGALLSLLFGCDTVKLAMVLSVAGLSIGLWWPRLYGCLMRAGSATLMLMAPWTFDIIQTLGLRWNNTLKWSLLHRFEIWGYCKQLIMKSFWVGQGFYATRLLTDPTEVNSLNWQLAAHHPHHGPIQIWVELGLVGALITLWLLDRIIRFITQLSIGPKEKTILLSQLACAMLICLSAHGIWQTFWLAGLVMIMNISYRLVQPAYKIEKETVPCYRP